MAFPIKEVLIERDKQLMEQYEKLQNIKRNYKDTRGKIHEYSLSNNTIITILASEFALSKATVERKIQDYQNAQKDETV